MHHAVLLTLVATSVLLVAPAASAGEAGVEPPIRQMIAGFNRGDVAAVKALQVVAPTIVDDVPPFIWSDLKAFGA